MSGWAKSKRELGAQDCDEGGPNIEKCRGRSILPPHIHAQICHSREWLTAERTA